MVKKDISAAEHVLLARKPGRPTSIEYIEKIFDDYFPLAGDRLSAEDESITGGVAFFHGRPVTVIAQRKGRNLEENVALRFGMPNPQGYRKAVRLMKQAEKFKRPVITFVDTPGAYPGLEAEMNGQGEAIARSIMTLTDLKVPVISVFIGEGGSGGALAMGVSDRCLMLENSIFSILSPEGFASILWKDSSRWKEAAEVMKLTAQDLFELGICDHVIEEGNISDSGTKVFWEIDRAISKALKELSRVNTENIIKERYKKLRRVGASVNATGKAGKDAERN